MMGPQALQSVQFVGPAGQTGRLMSFTAVPAASIHPAILVQMDLIIFTQLTPPASWRSAVRMRLCGQHRGWQ
jgi:hypothetical protein